VNVVYIVYKQSRLWTSVTSCTWTYYTTTSSTRR